MSNARFMRSNSQKVSQKTDTLTMTSKLTRLAKDLVQPEPSTPASSRHTATRRSPIAGIENSVRARASPSAPSRAAQGRIGREPLRSRRGAPRRRPTGTTSPASLTQGTPVGERRADHRLAAGHRLELHVAERFGARHRRQHEHVARDEERAQLLVVHLARKAEARRTSLAAGELAPLFPHRTIAQQSPRPPSSGAAASMRTGTPLYGTCRPANSTIGPPAARRISSARRRTLSLGRHASTSMPKGMTVTRSRNGSRAAACSASAGDDTRKRRAARYAGRAIGS